MAMTVLRAAHLSKVYGGPRGTVPVRALDRWDIAVEVGEFVGIMGPLGSGKSTLLHLLGSITSPTGGEIVVDGRRLTSMKGGELEAFRRRHMGFMFQGHNLIDSLTIKENVTLPLVLEGWPASEVESSLFQLARRFGLAEVLSRYPHQVPRAQKQQAAAVRALIHQPDLLLADEPTGHLDSRAARQVMDSLAAHNEQERTTILMATHHPAAASYCQRVLFMRDGQFYTEIRRGGSRRQFLDEILDVLSVIGGEPYYARCARP